MQTIIFYDVDGTLAEPFASPPAKLRKAIQSLDKAGIAQILCSGKNKEYLAGLARGLGIENSSDVIAENGGVIFDWRRQKIYHYAHEEKKKIEAISAVVEELMGGKEFYREPKETILTYFLTDKNDTPKIASAMKNMLKKEGMKVKHYPDGAIDIFSDTVNKGKAIKSYLEKFEKAKVYTCGDGINDLEMLEIGLPVSFSGAHPKVLELVRKREGVIAGRQGPDGLLEALSHLIFSDHLPAINHIEFIYRSWGSWEVLSTGKDFKVKKMTVSQGASLSLQKHLHRSEHWFVFEGQAKITLNNKEIVLSEGDDFYIPKKGIHRVENIGDTELVIIEVQRGSYLGEDDIVRFEI